MTGVYMVDVVAIWVVLSMPVCVMTSGTASVNGFRTAVEIVCNVNVDRLVALV